MDIAVSHEMGSRPITVFRPHGDIDASNYQELEQKVREAHAAGTRDLLLDLSDVPYVSSAGVRALHNIFVLLRGNLPSESDEAMKAGLRDGSFKSPHVKLLHASGRTLETMKVAGMDMFIEIYDDLKKALASF